MHMVNAAVLKGWTVLPDELIVARVLEGHRLKPSKDAGGPTGHDSTRRSSRFH